MSWLFSRALVEEYSEATCSDGARSALSSGSPTPRAFLPPDRMTAFSRPSRFGMTFGPLTDALGAELLTWFLADSPARTSALPAEEMDWTESDPDSGQKWRGSLAKYDHDSRSWRTAQHSLLGVSDEFSETFPRWGTTVAGELFLLPKPALPTSGKEFGFWPTPTCPNGGRSVAHVTDWRSPRTAYSASGKKVQVDLSQAVKRWPTPTVCGNHNRKGASTTSGDGLATAAGGALNPMWVEWLMGWPLGWTDLKPWGTDKSPKLPHSHGGF